MVDEAVGALPEQWREVTALLHAPIAWIPHLQSLLIEFFGDSSSGWTATVKWVLLAFPALIGLIAVWCTQLSLYTLPFRARRVRFMSTLVMTWWAAALAVCMYWAGLIRVALVAITVLILMIKLAFELTVRLVVWLLSPSGRKTGAFRPGVPWVAVGLLVFWSALEAIVFTCTILPALTDGLADPATQDLPRGTGALLWVFLFLLIMGSFVCIQLLLDAIKKRAFVLIALTTVVELFVMFFEVVFLYGGLAEAITPWIVAQAGAAFQPGVWFTLSVARFGWMAIRGMGWFLFGQYATPPLLRLLSRQPMATDPPAAPAARTPARRHAPSDDFGSHLAWFRDEGNRLLEHLCLPVLHLFAAALNFIIVAVAAQPLFSLPFKGLADAVKAVSASALQPSRSS
jgi:hypothetical protein